MSVPVIAALAFAAAQQPVPLRLEPPAGQVSHYRTSMRAFMDLSGTRAADSTRPAILQCTRVTTTVDSLEGEVRLVRAVTDTAHTEMQVLPAAVPTAVQDMSRGLTVTRRVDTRGRVLSESASGANLPPSTTAGLTGALGALSGRLPALPTGAVSVGQTWTDSQPVSLDAAGTVTRGWLRTSNRLERVSRIAGSRVATVSVRGAARYRFESHQLAMEVSGTSAGQIVWDLDRGRLVRLRANAAGRIELPALGQVMPFRMITITALAGTSAPGIDSSCGPLVRPPQPAAAPGTETVPAPAPPATPAAQVTPSKPAARDSANDSAVTAPLLEAMTRDLSALVAAEESYYAGHAIYSAALDSVGFQPSAGVAISFGAVSRNGWNATATHPGTSRTCAVFVGNAPTPIRGQYEREPRCR